MSKQEAPVIRINLKEHGNSDFLSVQEIGGFSVVVRSSDWTNGQLAIYIPPETIVDIAKPEFSFLQTDLVKEGKTKIKVKKLRGVYSIGLMIPAPVDAVEGQDYWEQLGLEHYEPELEVTRLSGSAVKGPSLWSSLSKYDIENGRKPSYQNWFYPNEPVWVSEKMHGAWIGITWLDGSFHVKSRGEWKKDEEGSRFWMAARKHPEIMDYCLKHPGRLVCGEMYGTVQKGYAYDAEGTVKIRIFDIRRPDYEYLSYQELQDEGVKFGLPLVPTVEVGPWDYNRFLELADTFSSAFPNVKNPEGLVIKPLRERRDPKHGRVFLKIVSNKYLEKS